MFSCLHFSFHLQDQSERVTLDDLREKSVRRGLDRSRRRFIEELTKLGVRTISFLHSPHQAHPLHPHHVADPTTMSESFAQVLNRLRSAPICAADSPSRHCKNSLKTSARCVFLPVQVALSALFVSQRSLTCCNSTKHWYSKPKVDGSSKLED